MSVVTRLVVAPGGRVVVHVDGEALGKVSETLAARWHLVVGLELNEEDLARLRAAAAADRARADGYRLLEQRARSHADVSSRLRARGHDEAAVAAAVDELTAAGLLDDADFARRYVADKRALNAWGTVRLRRGLLELGVDREVIEAALATDDPGGEAQEVARALELLRRRGAPQPPLDPARRRAYQTLLRKGFAAAVAYAAVRAWCSDDSDDRA